MLLEVLFRSQCVASRALEGFAQIQRPDLLFGNRSNAREGIAEHILWDSTAIKAREKPTSKTKNI